jgi:hypothetical protein
VKCAIGISREIRFARPELSTNDVNNFGMWPPSTFNWDSLPQASIVGRAYKCITTSCRQRGGEIRLVSSTLILEYKKPGFYCQCRRDRDISLNLARGSINIRGIAPIPYFNNQTACPQVAVRRVECKFIHIFLSFSQSAQGSPEIVNCRCRGLSTVSAQCTLASSSISTLSVAQRSRKASGSSS